MTCPEVRPLLPEHALGVLPEDAAAEVERHLEWCAGCRKELAQLHEGLETVALGLPLAEPPSSLEAAVVERVTAAAGKRRPSSRSGVRVLVAAALAAALLAMGAFGWAVAERGRAQDIENQMAGRIRGLKALLGDFRGNGTVSEAQLFRDDGQWTGTAIIFSAPAVDDLALVDVLLEDATHGPYSVRIVDRSGRSFVAGQLSKTNNGDWILLHYFGDSLAGAVSVSVVDGAGHVVFSGSVRPYPNS